ncbi:hypothetical protein [Phocoenobacter skyensis]|uniref:Uncharacterized protein n=1 Tax=Phocoenobacter skyensis TaxID=97481 RepID=A0A1H7V8P9_9PAST|nr:hypothetical protein [Pasteurella skyensis]QLB23341.1 hypothetical protein A6B44_09040 [Pasteurella skyensis]SEM05389.1 hypothetical protein SAMN05444853_1049 [Pasteurella skyensis]
MSAKINILYIIKEHFCTLTDNKGKLSKIDILTFFVLPIFISVTFSFYEIGMTKDITSLIISFSSIIVSLLVSVLILVYSTYDNIEKNEDNISNLKRKVLAELFSNISYTILSGIILVVFCLILNFLQVNELQQFTYKITINGNGIDLVRYFYTPVIIFFLLQMLLTLLMTLKRLNIIFFART